MQGDLHTYIMRVRDPEGENPSWVTYAPFKALSDGNAIKIAKDGYTGLLGSIEETQARLEVEIVQKYSGN